MDYATITLIIIQAKTVQRFVEGDQLPIILGELGFKAAQAALWKASDAMDSWAQVWSAINHLEAAEEALKEYLEGRQTRLAWGRPLKLVEVVDKRKTVLGLMALCYLYVGEIPLAKQILTDALYLDYSSGFSPKNVLHHLAVAVNPLTWWDLTLAVRGQKFSGAFGDFVSAIAQLIEYEEAGR